MQIYIYDDLHAEDGAMLQALYSRSKESVVNHIKKVEETGSGKFMEKYYIQYGHSSIGQTGSTTLFIEDISLLAAKAIQDSQLYNGQECSTRFLDFSAANYYDPLKTKESEDILDTWLSFYKYSLKELPEHLKEIHSQPENLSKTEYDKAIKARCFDIARGFLPAGMKTNVSLHTTLHHAYNHFSALKYHPLNEVNKLANQSWEELFKKYPNSFKLTFNREQQEYLSKSVGASAYSECYNTEVAEDFKITSSISNDLIKHVFGELLESRPPGSNLPKSLKFYGDIRFEFNIDFGSFRDFQRHRSILTYNPIINSEIGFNQWYIDQFPEENQSEVKEVVNSQFEKIAKLKEETSLTKENLQYFYPLGTSVRVGSVASLPSLVYIIELRSRKTVHPTLRQVVHKIAKYLELTYPTLKLHIDYDENDFTFKRGSQDIIEKS